MESLSSIAPAPRRRVYATELKRRLDCSDTWLRRLEKEGRIPRSRKDTGTKRKFWFDDELQAFEI
jgi:hypothetical protein